jgi:hypothetical protein
MLKAEHGRLNPQLSVLTNASVVPWKGTMGRPIKLDLREIVNVLFYWERIGCQ